MFDQNLVQNDFISKYGGSRPQPITETTTRIPKFFNVGGNQILRHLFFIFIEIF
jgi:hypothetical protein